MTCYWGSLCDLGSHFGDPDLGGSIAALTGLASVLIRGVYTCTGWLGCGGGAVKEADHCDESSSEDEDE